MKTTVGIADLALVLIVAAPADMNAGLEEAFSNLWAELATAQPHVARAALRFVKQRGGTAPELVDKLDAAVAVGAAFS